MPKSSTEVVGCLPSFICELARLAGAVSMALKYAVCAYQTPSTSPLAPAAMTGPSSSPNLSSRLLHCKEFQPETSSGVMATDRMRWAALQYGQYGARPACYSVEPPFARGSLLSYICKPGGNW